MIRQCQTKIVATLGPASSSLEMVRDLFLAGVDMFRLNFSHGSHDDHRARYETVRLVETEMERPIAILADLQGPKLRVGAFAGGSILLTPGQKFRLDLDPAPGDAKRAALPHPEIFAALAVGTELLLDDGRLRLRVERYGADFAEVMVLTGGPLSDRKGVNVPNAVLPLSPVTPKDKKDLAFALELGVDWVALSFVQRPADLHEARALIAGRAGLLAKIEKPSAIDQIEAIVDAADAVMVARGDLGVEMPPETVPALQKRIIRVARHAGKPVVVATQMLESMTTSPAPTRAEASDVATAVYDGADAVMLSAESASGKYPVEAVRMMDAIIARTEEDPYCRRNWDLLGVELKGESDAICQAARDVAKVIGVAAIACFTTSGSTTLRMARLRPPATILSLAPTLAAARRMVPVWGVYSVLTDEKERRFDDKIAKACKLARDKGLADRGDKIAVTAGVPFGRVGSTNLLRIVDVNPPESGGNKAR